MRGDHSFISSAVGAAAVVLLLAGCATTEEVPPPVVAMPVEEPPPQPEPPVQVTPALRDDAPLRYVVKKGDTLWDISQRFLRDSWQWPELWYANPDVNNPHLIYPGDVLYLYWAGGRPRLAREGDPIPADTVTAPPAVVPPAVTDKVAPQVRETPLEEAIASIPLDAIRGFLRSPRLVSKDEIDDAPYVLAFEEDRLAIGDDSIAYAMDVVDRSIVNYQIVRVGQQYRDPDDGDVIGYEAQPVAEIQVREWGEPSTIYVARSMMETRVGDVLLPSDVDSLPTRFYPNAPKRRIEGRIISVYNGMTRIGQYQVVAINRGSEVGLRPGHVLSVLQTGRRAKDPQSVFGSRVQLPDINAGNVMVFKTTPRLSYALVMTALRQIHVLDAVETPDPNAIEAE